MEDPNQVDDAQEVAYQTEAEEAQSGGFVITDLGGIDWFLCRLANINAEITRREANFEKQKKRLQNEEKSFIWLFGKQVEEVGAQLIAEEKAKKKRAPSSIILDNGTISLKSTKGGFEIAEDCDEVAIQFAQTEEIEAEVLNTKTVTTINAKGFQNFLSDAYNCCLAECEGDEAEAKKKFRAKYPFADIKNPATKLNYKAG